MKVAHLTSVDITLRHLLLAQLRASRDAGDEVIAISAPGPDVAVVEAEGIRHVALPSSTRGMHVLADLRTAAELWRILRRERPDLLHTHNPKPGLYGRIVGRLAGVPCVVNTVHGLYATEDDQAAKRALVYALEAGASRCSDAELVQNPEDLVLMRRLRLAPRNRLHYLGNGVDLDRFDARRVPISARYAIRSELGVRDDQVLVGIVARLVAEKGYRELFDAMALLDERYVLVAIGHNDPDKPDALDEATLHRARRAGVRFVAARDDIERYYRAMDLFVLPSHREGFPRAAMEAAAMGLPVVATDVRGCREVATPGRNGLLVPPRDPTALAAAIRTIGDDDVLTATMGAASVRMARERFDERHVVGTVLETYRTARRRHGRPVYRITKRAFDIAAASTALALLAPVYLAVAAAVRLTMGRPVLFTQARPGRSGVIFRIRKFRTMRDARDEHGNVLPDEARLTRFGRWLRSTSIDELPELWNVVRGDMSLVGPRPLLVEYLPLYSSEQARRHDVRPGVTGWAQVNGRNAQTWEERLALDTWYVEHASFRLDLRILAATVGTVVRRDGISREGHATMPNFEGTGPTGLAKVGS